MKKSHEKNAYNSLLEKVAVYFQRQDALLFLPSQNYKFWWTCGCLCDSFTWPQDASPLFSFLIFCFLKCADCQLNTRDCYANVTLRLAEECLPPWVRIRFYIKKKYYYCCHCHSCTNSLLRSFIILFITVMNKEKK